MYLKQIYLSKTTAAGCLFKNSKKKPKKVKTQKHKNNSRIAIRLLSYHQFFFVNEQNCLLHSLDFIFFVNIYSTMMYNIFDINATEVKTNIPCK